jgi:hypothetical protein
MLHAASRSGFKHLLALALQPAWLRSSVVNQPGEQPLNAAERQI